MPDLDDPLLLATVAVVTAVDAAILAALLALLRPGPQGYFARNGTANGWGLCLAVSGAFTALSLLPVPVIVPLVLWWVVALVVFRLTVRQTVKFGIAVNLIWLGLVFGVASRLG